MARKLSDNQVGDRLHEAYRLLDCEAETVHGDAALKAIKRGIMTTQAALLIASEDAEATDQTQPSPSPNS